MQSFVGYFEELLDVPPPRTRIDTSGMNPLLTADLPISTCPLTVSEIEKALGGMKSGKAAGVCGIPVELLKAGDGAVLRGLAAVFNKTWKYLRDPFRLENGTHFPNLPG